MSVVSGCLNIAAIEELNHNTRSVSISRPRTKKIVAAIPCLNTQRTIASVIAGSKKFVDQVIVVDDGSDDKTAAVARKAGAMVFTHKENRGKGAAMKTALENIEADIVVFIDGDGQHDTEDIPKLIEPLLDGKADFVIGSRYLADSEVSDNPWLRRASNGMASFVISYVISVLEPITLFISGNRRVNKSTADKNTSKAVKISFKKRVSYKILNGGYKWISDCTSGFTAMKLENYHHLELVSNGYQIETEMIFEQARIGSIIAETPISCKWGESGSKLSVARDGLSTLALLTKKLLGTLKYKSEPQPETTESGEEKSFPHFSAQEVTSFETKQRL